MVKKMNNSFEYGSSIGVVAVAMILSGCGGAFGGEDYAGESDQGYLNSDLVDQVVAEGSHYETPLIGYDGGDEYCGRYTPGNCRAPEARIDIIDARVCDASVSASDKSCGDGEVFEVEGFDSDHVQLRSVGVGEAHLVVEVETRRDEERLEDSFPIESAPVSQLEFDAGAESHSRFLNLCDEDEDWFDDDRAVVDPGGFGVDALMFDEGGRKLAGRWSVEADPEARPYGFEGPVEPVEPWASRLRPAGSRAGLEFETTEPGVARIFSRKDDAEIEFHIADDVAEIDEMDVEFSDEQVELDRVSGSTMVRTRLLIDSRPLCGGPPEAKRVESKTPEVCGPGMEKSHLVDIEPREVGTCRLEVTVEETNHGESLESVEEIEVVSEVDDG